MTCTSCGSSAPEGAKFCMACGTPLASSCPSCGWTILDGARFCAACGTPLTAGVLTEAPGRALPPTRDRETVVAERRLVSVLFADLVGFTTASEGRDAEDTRELLTRYFETARVLIERYGGTVEKFIGDAVMAVWGTPVATEDDAERAVRAALDLVDAVPSLDPALAARAGVLTGEAAVTLGATDQGMVAGDLVNTAARIQSVAQPGSILVGEATRRASEAAIAYEDAGEHDLKGKAEPIRLARALRVVANRGGEGRSAGLEAPFVGRDREFRLVHDAFHATADEGRAHLVSVFGVAGIGKSRLAWEFEKHIDGLVESVYWHRGRCLSYGEGVAYWALADMVRSRCRILEDEAGASALDKLDATLATYMVDDEECAFARPRLAQLLGFGDLDGADRRELFSAWRLFFERLAASSPVVLAFEDMQWADESLLDFVEELLEWSRGHAIFVLTLARPELLERRPTWGAGLRNFTSLHLEPLPDDAMQLLLDGLVPGLPDVARANILTRAEGIPLYAVETVRMLLDRGLLRREGAAYALTGPVHELDVPETLHALIAARLDGLDAHERSALQDAAVLGKTFTREGLSRLTGRPLEELDALLTGLVRKEVLTLEADPLSPEQGQYGFLQDMVRRIAYETLSRRDRAARHLAAAEHLSAAMAEDEVAEVVAAHLVEAYRASGDGDPALRARTRDALTRAGERAASVGAPAEAKRAYLQAADLEDDPVPHAALIERAGLQARRADRRDDARELLERARTAFEQAGEHRAAARVSARVGEIDFAEGHLAEAVARLRSAADTFGDDDDDADAAVVLGELGRFVALSGDYEGSLPYIERALALAEKLDLPEVLVNALATKSMLLPRMSRPIEGQLVMEGAVRLGRERGLHSATLRAMNNLSAALDATDSLREALRVTDDAIALARRAGEHVWLGTLEVSRVGLIVPFGDWDEAVAGEERLRDAAMDPGWAEPLIEVARVHVGRGDLVAAREVFERYVAESDDPQGVVERAAVRACIARAEGDVRGGLDATLAALPDAESLGLSGLAKYLREEILACAVALPELEVAGAQLAWIDALFPGERTPMLRAMRARFGAQLEALRGSGDPTGGFVAGAALYDEIGLRVHAAMTRLEHLEWLVHAGRTAPSELVEVTRSELERLRATAWLERLATAEAELGAATAGTS